MSDRFTEAVKEQQDKSPFVCTSCGHPHDITKVHEHAISKAESEYHDEFSEAVEEEVEKSAFKCENCGQSQVISKQSLH